MLFPVDIILLNTERPQQLQHEIIAWLALRFASTDPQQTLRIECSTILSPTSVNEQKTHNCLTDSNISVLQ